MEDRSGEVSGGHVPGTCVARAREFSSLAAIPDRCLRARSLVRFVLTVRVLVAILAPAGRIESPVRSSTVPMTFGTSATW
jgi:hypothetical protein